MGPSPGKRPLVGGQGQFGVGTCLQQAASGGCEAPEVPDSLRGPVQGRALRWVLQGLEVGVPEWSSLEPGRNTELRRPVAGCLSVRAPHGPGLSCRSAHDCHEACVLQALGALEDLICWGGGGDVPKEERGGLSSQ